MTATVFVDTNVLVYARDASEVEKQPKAEAWMRYLWREKSGRLSFQVLNEYYFTVTGKLQPGLDPAEARNEVRSLLAWRPVPADRRVLEGAWSVQDRYQLAWWDSLIVAAARAAGSRFLLTEDLQHHQVLGDLTVLNPFESSPGTFLED
jgi:predicted nucleic acid-binding protein